MTKFLSQTFLRGLAVIVPIAAAVYVLVWIVTDLERLVRRALLLVLPERFYIPGLGVALVLGGVFLIGLLMYPWLTRKLFDGIDAILRRIPLFASIYSPVRDLMNMLGGSMQEKLGQPVLVRVPNTEMDTMGFITRESNEGLPEGFIPDDHVVVFVQWSSQIGGYCFVVPRDSVRPVNLSVEEALRWALTAGVSAPRLRRGTQHAATEPAKRDVESHSKEETS